MAMVDRTRLSQKRIKATANLYRAYAAKVKAGSALTATRRKLKAARTR